MNAISQEAHNLKKNTSGRGSESSICHKRHAMSRQNASRLINGSALAREILGRRRIAITVGISTRVSQSVPLGDTKALHSSVLPTMPAHEKIVSETALVAVHSYSEDRRQTGHVGVEQIAPRRALRVLLR